MDGTTGGVINTVGPEHQDRAELALQLYEVNVKLRPDREPPVSYVEWARLSSERRRLQMALGWLPNEGRR